jgi:hypothetical protein
MVRIVRESVAADVPMTAKKVAISSGSAKPAEFVPK